MPTTRAEEGNGSPTSERIQCCRSGDLRQLRCRISLCAHARSGLLARAAKITRDADIIRISSSSFRFASVILQHRRWQASSTCERKDYEENCFCHAVAFWPGRTRLGRGHEDEERLHS